MQTAAGPKFSSSIAQLEEENVQLKKELALCRKFQNVPHGGGRKTRHAGYRIRWGKSITKDFAPLDFVRGEAYQIKFTNGRKKAVYVRDISNSYIKISNRLDSEPEEWQTVPFQSIRKIRKRLAMNPQEGGRRRRRRRTKRKRRKGRRRSRRSRRRSRRRRTRRR